MKDKSHASKQTNKPSNIHTTFMYTCRRAMTPVLQSFVFYLAFS